MINSEKSFIWFRATVFIFLGYLRALFIRFIYFLQCRILLVQSDNLQSLDNLRQTQKFYIFHFANLLFFFLFVFSQTILNKAPKCRRHWFNHVSRGIVTKNWFYEIFNITRHLIFHISDTIIYNVLSYFNLFLILINLIKIFTKGFRTSHNFISKGYHLDAKILKIRTAKLNNSAKCIINLFDFWTFHCSLNNLRKFLITHEFQLFFWYFTLYDLLNSFFNIRIKKIQNIIQTILNDISHDKRLNLVKDKILPKFNCFLLKVAFTNFLCFFQFLFLSNKNFCQKFSQFLKSIG